MAESVIALIVDIVGSRKAPDRKAVQQSIRQAFDVAEETYTFKRELWPTAGDEFQATFTTIADALLATAIARLSLPQDVDCRFGLGQGSTEDIDDGATGSIQDGSAWWRARAAIEESHRREQRSDPYLRTWFVSEDPGTAIINAYLLLRDEKINSMSSRDRRLTAGTLLGRNQTELARLEDISQPAVSQGLRRSGGAALIAAHNELMKARAND